MHTAASLRLRECADCCESLARATASGEAERPVRAALLTRCWTFRSALTGPDLMSVLRRIESRGTFELSHRVRSICSRVLRYAGATGRKCEDVAADLIGLLIPVEPENMAAIVEPIQVVRNECLTHILG